MNERHVMHTLTNAQSDFAAQNHHLVFEYLDRHRLDHSEFYDVVILRYLSAVQRYDEIGELRQYSFRTIAFSAMDSAVGHYREAQSRKMAREVSLYGLTRDHLTYEETVGDPDPGFLAVEHRDELERLSPYVTEQEGNVVRLRLRGLTHREIGETLGCSRSTVSGHLGSLRRRISSGALAA